MLGLKYAYEIQICYINSTTQAHSPFCCVHMVQKEETSDRLW